MATVIPALHKGEELSCICQVPDINKNVKMLLRAIVHSDFAKSSLKKSKKNKIKQHRRTTGIEPFGNYFFQETG